MHEIDMRDHARNQNNIDRSFAHYLIGDVDVAAQRVARLGQSKIVHLPATPGLLAILFPRVKRVNSSRRAKTGAPSIPPARRWRQRAQWLSCTRSPRTAGNRR